MLNRRRRSLGAGLFDAVVAMAILSFGMLALARMQTRVVGAATEASSRLAASRLADELLSSAIVDRTNAANYVPTGGCASAQATAMLTDWCTRVVAELPSAFASGAFVGGAQRTLAVTLKWTGKGTNEQRVMTVVTDVSP
jgi:Tfp pilus assembly protein PilV